MKRYVKLDFTFKQKVKFLLYGFIPEELLPVNEKIVQVKEPKRSDIPPSFTSSNGETINTNEEELVIPFFDVNESETKSNF